MKHFFYTLLLLLLAATGRACERAGAPLTPQAASPCTCAPGTCACLTGQPCVNWDVCPVQAGPVAQAARYNASQVIYSTTYPQTVYLSSACASGSCGTAGAYYGADGAVYYADASAGACGSAGGKKRFHLFGGRPHWR